MPRKNTEQLNVYPTKEEFDRIRKAAATPPRQSISRFVLDPALAEAERRLQHAKS